MVVADTGAIVALLDRGDRHHRVLKNLFVTNPDAWILPWAILPEVDYLAATRLGPAAAKLWRIDLAAGAFAVEWGSPRDLTAADALMRRYASLDFGLVDAIVMAVAERRKADIATLDIRDFAPVRLAHAPRLLPRDLERA